MAHPSVRALPVRPPVVLAGMSNVVGSHQLWQAAWDGRDEVLETLLQRFGLGRGRGATVSADINWVNPYGYDSTPLQAAVRNGHASCVRTLLAYGADVKVPNSAGITALHEAGLSGRADVMQALLEAGADVDARDEGACTALHYAARDGHALCVSALLRHRSDANAQTSMGETALLLAVEFGNPDCTRLLLEAGADVNLRERGMMTPLHVAARHGRGPYRDCTLLLLRYRAEIAARYKGRTPLHEACLRGNAGQAKILLEYGAEVDAREEHSGMTGLHCAVMAEEGDDCVRYLLLFGANPDALDGSGTRSVLSLARHRGASARIIEYLLAANVDITRDSRRAPHDPRYVNRRALALLESFAALSPEDQERKRVEFQKKWKMGFVRSRRRILALWRSRAVVLTGVKSAPATASAGGGGARSATTASAATARTAVTTAPMAAAAPGSSPTAGGGRAPSGSPTGGR